MCVAYIGSRSRSAPTTKATIWITKKMTHFSRSKSLIKLSVYCCFYRLAFKTANWGMILKLQMYYSNETNCNQSILLDSSLVLVTKFISYKVLHFFVTPDDTLV